MTKALTVQQESESLKALLLSPHNAARIRSVAAKHLDPDRLTRLALVAVNKTPDLQRCTPASIVAGVMEAAQLGLEIGGSLGHGYLVPFRRRVQIDKQWRTVHEAAFIPGWKGLCVLAWRSAQIEIDSQVVCEHDEFDWERGTRARLYFRESLADDRGAPMAAWALARFPDGRIQFEVMSLQQLEGIRAGAKAAAGPWSDEVHRLEMYRKTVIRRLCKRLPITGETWSAALDSDARADGPTIDVPVYEPPTRAEKIDSTGLIESRPPMQAPVKAEPDAEPRAFPEDEEPKVQQAAATSWPTEAEGPEPYYEAIDKLKAVDTMTEEELLELRALIRALPEPWQRRAKDAYLEATA